MTPGDGAAIITTIIAVLGGFTALVRWIIRRAVADNNLGHRIDEHERQDAHQFSELSARVDSIDERLEQGGRAMRETDNKIERLDAKVDVLIDYFVGGSPESRAVD